MVEASLLSQLIPRAKLSMMLMMMRISGPICLICDFIAMKFVLSCGLFYFSFLLVYSSFRVRFIYLRSKTGVGVSYSQGIFASLRVWVLVRGSLSVLTSRSSFCFYLSCCLSFFGSFHTSHTVQRESDKERAARRDAGEAAAV